MTTLNQETFSAACQQVYKVKRRDERVSKALAENIVEDAETYQRVPHGRGTYTEHYQGKLAEIVVERVLYDMTVEYKAYYRELWGPLVHFDFIVKGVDGKPYDLDVKSGKLAPGRRFEDVYIESFGLQVPDVQAGPSLALIVPYVLFDATMSHALSVGFAYNFEVRRAPIVKGNPDYRCVPIARLHPWTDFESQVKMLTMGAESLEKLSLIRSV